MDAYSARLRTDEIPCYSLQIFLIREIFSLLISLGNFCKKWLPHRGIFGLNRYPKASRIGNFSVKFPVSRVCKVGDRFAYDCVHHHASPPRLRVALPAETTR